MITRGETAVIVAAFVLGGIVGPALIGAATWIVTIWFVVLGSA